RRDGSDSRDRFSKCVLGDGGSNRGPGNSPRGWLRVDWPSAKSRAARLFAGCKRPGKMSLPDYFMADLPPEAELTSTMIGQACETLRRNRERYLAGRSTASMIKLLAEVGASWLQPENRFRKLALDQGPHATGFSSPTLAHGLDSFFRQITEQNLEAWLEQDLGDRRRLEQMAATAAEDKTGRASTAVAPELIVHITAGTLPCSALQSMVAGILLRSAQFIKCASGA